MADLSFLAEPGEVTDWRRVLLWDVAAQCGVLGALPGSAQEVAERTGLDGQAVRVLLEALSAVGVLVPVGDGRYAPAAGTTEDAGATIGHHARALRRWANGLEPRLRGQAAAAPGPMGSPEQFHDALAVTARSTAPAVVDLCLQRFPEARTVLDLGGLHGEYALEFARRGLQATMQDQPQMVDVVRRRGRLDAAGVALFEGSFFDVVPDGPFDLFFCMGITHTFDGDRNRRLFENLKRVQAPGGGVAVVTFLRGLHPVTALFAVQMLLNDNGGDTHTEDEYRSWLSSAGFTVDPTVHALAGASARSVLFAT